MIAQHPQLVSTVVFAERLKYLSQKASENKQKAKREAVGPIRSGPCRVLWLSHDWTGPRGQCGRCGQVRG